MELKWDLKTYFKQSACKKMFKTEDYLKISIFFLSESYILKYTWFKSLKRISKVEKPPETYNSNYRYRKFFKILFGIK